MEVALIFLRSFAEDISITCDSIDEHRRQDLVDAFTVLLPTLSKNSVSIVVSQFASQNEAMVLTRLSLYDGISYS